MVSALDSGASGPCSWARHLTLIVRPLSLSTQVYKWITSEFNAGDNHAMDYHPIRGSRNTPSRFMLRKPG